MSPADSATRAFRPLLPAREVGEADFIEAVGHRLQRNGEPVRFRGANPVADGSLPSPPRANPLVPRMRRMGHYLIRFHRIDNPRGQNSLVHGAPTGQIDLTLLQKMEYLIFRMK